MHGKAKQLLGLTASRPPNQALLFATDSMVAIFRIKPWIQGAQGTIETAGRLMHEYSEQSLEASLLRRRAIQSLNDDEGYSSILANGASRWQERNQVLIQHRTPLRVGNKNALFMVNLYHQDQASNIELFELTDTAIELGISIAL